MKQVMITIRINSKQKQRLPLVKIANLIIKALIALTALIASIANLIK